MKSRFVASSRVRTFAKSAGTRKNRRRPYSSAITGRTVNGRSVDGEISAEKYTRTFRIALGTNRAIWSHYIQSFGRTYHRCNKCFSADRPTTYHREIRFFVAGSAISRDVLRFEIGFDFSVERGTECSKWFFYRNLMEFARAR